MKKIFISLFALFIFISCDNKESYMQDFSQFIQEVEDNADKYSEKDWKKADKKFEEYTGSIYKKYAEELTAEEKNRDSQMSNDLCRIKGKSRHKKTLEKA